MTVGSNATLQTLLVNANPMNTTIQWLRPSGEIIPESQYTEYSSVEISNGTVYTLNLINLTQLSGGIYTCEVGNRIEISQVTFTLVVIGKSL